MIIIVWYKFQHLTTKNLKKITHTNLKTKIQRTTFGTKYPKRNFEIRIRKKKSFNRKLFSKLVYTKFSITFYNIQLT